MPVRINVACVGKVRERYFLDAIDEYRKRVSGFCRLEIVEVPESDVATEGRALLRAARGALVACDSAGELVTSPDVAKTISDFASAGDSEISFAIGGPDGLSPDVKRAARKIVSFGRVTYPHRLMRVILLEQIYRAFSILAGTAYHR